MFFGASFRKVLAMFSVSTKTNTDAVLEKSFSWCILPVLYITCFFWKRENDHSLLSCFPTVFFKAELISEQVTEPRKKAKCPAWLNSDDYSLCQICDHNKWVLTGINMCMFIVPGNWEPTPKIWDYYWGHYNTGQKGPVIKGLRNFVHLNVVYLTKETRVITEWKNKNNRKNLAN